MPAAGVHLWKRLKSAILGKKKGPFSKKRRYAPFFRVFISQKFPGRLRRAGTARGAVEGAGDEKL